MEADLGGLIYGMHHCIASCLHLAKQQAPSLDRKGQSSIDVLLKSIGGMSVKGNGCTIWRVLPVATIKETHPEE